MKFNQISKISLKIDNKYIDLCNSDRLNLICQSILGQFRLSKDVCKVEINVEKRETIFIEFVVA